MLCCPPRSMMRSLNEVRSKITIVDLHEYLKLQNSERKKLFGLKWQVFYRFNREVIKLWVYIFTQMDPNGDPNGPQKFLIKDVMAAYC